MKQEKLRLSQIFTLTHLVGKLIGRMWNFYSVSVIKSAAKLHKNSRSLV